jgi:hypothetical protein
MAKFKLILSVIFAQFTHIYAYFTTKTHILAYFNHVGRNLRSFWGDTRLNLRCYIRQTHIGLGPIINLVNF